jgi:DNA-binding SARP family transcriptional activator
VQLPDHESHTAPGAPAQSLRLTILGRSELLAADGRAIKLPGERCRLLLATLACRNGRATSAGVLTEVLWGDQPPRSSYPNLQTYVWQIRRALSAAEPGGGQRLVYRSGTYGLHLDERRSDLHELRTLHRRAGQLGGRPRERLALLDRAYELWRGRPFSTAAVERSGTVAAEQRRCEELYLRLCEDRRAAALDCGNAVDLGVGR